MDVDMLHGDLLLSNLSLQLCHCFKLFRGQVIQEFVQAWRALRRRSQSAMSDKQFVERPLYLRAGALVRSPWHRPLYDPV